MNLAAIRGLLRLSGGLEDPSTRVVLGHRLDRVGPLEAQTRVIDHRGLVGLAEGREHAFLGEAHRVRHGERHQGNKEDGGQEEHQRALQSSDSWRPPRLADRAGRPRFGAGADRKR